MKLDTDPGRTRELEVLCLFLLLAFVLASLADLLRAPAAPLITDMPTAAQADAYAARQGILIEPWTPSQPDVESPSPSQSTHAFTPRPAVAATEAQ